MNRRLHRKLAAAVWVGGLLAAACGGARAKPSPTCPPSAMVQPDVNDHGSVPATGQTDTVTMGDAFFVPTCLTGVHAGTVALVFRNRGRILHNISFPDQGVDHDVAPGDFASVRVTMGKEALRFECKYHRLSGMVGALLPK